MNLIDKNRSAGLQLGGVERKRCREGQARLSMKEIGSKVIFNFEGTCQQVRMCDCIIFIEAEGGLLVVVVELKSRTVEAENVLKQLQSCTRVAERILAIVTKDCRDVKFGAVVLARRLHSTEHAMLSKTSLLFQGKKKFVLPKTYGSRGTVPLHELIPLFF